MLFERIRRTQKPIYIAVAFVFCFGFVVFGVGAGASSVNLGDLFNGGGGSGDQISKLNSTVSKNPKDAAAWLQLAQAYTTAGNNDQAISAYQTYMGLKPNDIGVAQSAAALLEARGQLSEQNAAAYENVANYYSSASTNSGVAGLKISSLFTDPIATQESSTYSQQASIYSQSAQSDFRTAMGYRQTIAKSDPKNAINQDLLGYDAYGAQDYATSLAAFKAYLKLQPTSSEAKRIQGFLPQIEAQAAQQAAGSTQPAG